MHDLVVTAYALCAGILALHGLHMALLAGRALRRPVPSYPAPDAWPHVTVQLPLYNEAAVAERLIDAVMASDYPSFDVQVLDDSTDETSVRVAEVVEGWARRGYAIEHIQRPHRSGFKAGALAAGLARTDASLVAVFDADFVPPPGLLRRLAAPLLADERLAFAQARWTHRNADASWLTRLQAAVLDAHFAVEQHGRSASGLVFTFNGTAGLWRRAAIDDAGGWRGDTLAEDFDLSLRAQARGWRGVFLDDLEAPADLPADVHALRAQQRRWARGTAEVGQLLFRHVVASPSLSGVARAFATLHLLTPVTFVAGLGLLLLYAPAVLTGGLPVWVQVLGGVGFAGVAVEQAVAVHRRGGSAMLGLLRSPLWMVGMTALVPACAVAAVQALGRRRGVFERTAKSAHGRRYRTPRPLGLMAFETMLLGYVLVGAGRMVQAEAWPWLPFQGVMVAAMGWLLLHNAVDGRNASGSDLRSRPSRTLTVPVSVKSPSPEPVGEACPP